MAAAGCKLRLRSQESRPALAEGYTRTSNLCVEGAQNTGSGARSDSGGDAKRTAENQSRLESKREIVVAPRSFLDMKETRFPQRTRNPARIAGFLRLVTAMLVLATLASLPACYHSARAKEHVEKGNGYAAKNQLAEAESEYRQAISIDPKFGDAYDRLGLVELRQDRPTAAATSFSRAVELDPKNLEARLRLGNLLVSAAQYEAGRRQAEAVLDRDGRNSGAHRLIGQADLRQLDYVGAESELRQAIDLAPHDPQAYEDLGLAQLLDAEYGAAEKSFENAVEVKPEDPQTYINLAGFYKTQNALARVEQVLAVRRVVQVVRAAAPEVWCSPRWALVPTSPRMIQASSSTAIPTIRRRRSRISRSTVFQR